MAVTTADAQLPHPRKVRREAIVEKTALVLRHVHFEDLGSFAKPLAQASFKIRYADVSDPDFCSGDPLEPDLLIILGGPIGVYEDAAYPFITTERLFIKRRLEADRPTLGICLGAQLIASALGAKVFPSGVKEIGFSQIGLTATGAAGPLRHLAGIPVLHWHGDTYTLPAGAVNLASTSRIEQQAFAVGVNILGLQFHPEAETDLGFERWLVGHAAELAATKIDPASLRQSGLRNSAGLRSASTMMLADWLCGIRTAP